LWANRAEGSIRLPFPLFKAAIKTELILPAVLLGRGRHVTISKVCEVLSTALVRLLTASKIAARFFIGNLVTAIWLAIVESLTMMATRQVYSCC
jgi:hypothetical protein